MVKRQAKMIAVALFAPLAILLLCSCSQGVQTGSTQSTGKDNNMALTMEYVIEHSDATAEDFEGIDFDAFMDKYQLDADRVSRLSVKELIGFYRKELDSAVVDYSDVMERGQGKISAADFDDISVLAWKRNENATMETMVIDFDRNAIYYGYGDIIDRMGDSEKVCELTRKQREFIKEALVKSKIDTWQNEYAGTSEGTTGHYWWAIGLRLADGTQMSYHGGGVNDSGTPDELEALLDDLRPEYD